MKKLLNAFQSFWQKKRNRIILLLAALLLVAAGAVYGTLAPQQVRVVQAAVQPLADTFYEDGAVRAVARSVISADSGGKVLRVEAQEGQQVQAGDVLFALDTADLQAERALLQAERNAAIASWEQSREAIAQQIAGLQAQRASYGAADVSRLYDDQIALLNDSMDARMHESVAASFEQMIRAAEYRLRHGGSDTAAMTAQSQLDAARAQAASVKNQAEQYKLQLQTQLFELEGKLDEATAQNNPEEIAFYTALIDELKNGNAILTSYDEMQKEANAQVRRLEDAIAAGADVWDSKMAAETELRTLQEQYSAFQFNTKAQMIGLTAQQEQAIAAQKSASGARSKLGEQIALLEKSMQEESGTAGYHATLLEKADAALADLDRRIALCTVQAPIGGIVGALPIKQGEYIPAGSAVTEVVDAASLQVECMLLTEDAGSVHPGMQAVLIWERRDGDVEYPCTVREVSALAVDSISAVGLLEQRVKVLLQPDFGAQAHPGDGFAVRLRFIANAAQAVAVPKSAVFQSESGDAVFVVQDGAAVLRPVSLGMESGELVAVLAGLQPEEQVIADPEADGVREGAKVKAG